MNLSITAFGVILTAIFGAGGVSVAALQAAVGRGGRRADIAAKLVDTSEKLLDRFDRELADVEEQCKSCHTRLTAAEARVTEVEKRERTLETALRTIVRVLDDKDPTQIESAIDVARRLI